MFFFSFRAAVKLANMDFMLDFMFTSPKDAQGVSSATHSCVNMRTCYKCFPICKEMMFPFQSTMSHDMILFWFKDRAVQFYCDVHVLLEWHSSRTISEIQIIIKHLTLWWPLGVTVHLVTNHIFTFQWNFLNLNILFGKCYSACITLLKCCFYTVETHAPAIRHTIFCWHLCWPWWFQRVCFVEN